MIHSRRDFLRLLGIAMGTTLSGCGGSGSDYVFTETGSTGPVPLAYRYLKLIKSGDPLPGGSRLASKVAFSLDSTGDAPPPFMGAVMLTDSRHVYFHALDETQTRGIYRIDVDANGVRSATTPVIREGDVLPDGTVVKDFSDGDVNNEDDFIVAVENPDGVYSIQYAEDGGAFSPLIKSGGALGNIKLAEDIDQYQAVADDGSLLFVAEYMDEAGDCQGEGLFYLPGGRPERTRKVLAKGDLLPGTRSVIECFGATEFQADGYYIAQGSARPVTGSDPGGRPFTFLLRGYRDETPQVLVLDPALGSFDVSSPNFGALAGNVIMCPRLGDDGSVAYILQGTEPDRTSLWVNPPGALTNRRELALANLAGWPAGASRATRSPRGASVLSLLPPVFGPNGLIYFEMFTDQGMEIVLWDGSNLSTLLARGDVVDGKRVETIIFGALPDCVNSHGEFAAIIEFDDGETDVYLGIPV
jgi:hypothetical protein